LCPIVGNLIPIAFQAPKEAIIFVNENLLSLHTSLPGIKEIRYKTTIFPIGRRPATKVMRKTKKDITLIEMSQNVTIQFMTTCDL